MSLMSFERELYDSMKTGETGNLLSGWEESAQVSLKVNLGAFLGLMVGLRLLEVVCTRYTCEYDSPSMLGNAWKRPLRLARQPNPCTGSNSPMCPTFTVQCVEV